MSSDAYLKDPDVPFPDADSESRAAAFSLDNHTAFLLRRAHQRASSVFLSTLGEAQLTPTQFFAMARLKQMGPLSQNRLGRLAAMDPATIQGVIRRLVERDLIERTPDQEDRRRMTLRLTAQGESLIEGLLQEAPLVDSSILAPLTPSECDTLIGLLKRLA